MVTAITRDHSHLAALSGLGYAGRFTLPSGAVTGLASRVRHLTQRNAGMTANTKPKRTLLAYCALAERLNSPGAGVIQALTPFLAEACHAFSGELFDASKFSAAVAERFGIRIPRLAALGLAEHLEKEGLLTAVSGHALSTVYRYAKFDVAAADLTTSAVTEVEIERVLRSFVEHCKSDSRLSSIEEGQLHASFLDRLLHPDSMRLLSRKEGSIAARKGPATLVLSKPAAVADQREQEEMHLDFVVSQYLLDLRDSNPSAFDRVSDIAFANMAAEALACFNEPPTTQTTLVGLTVYLDSPLLLDMLGVNTEYAEYGTELLEAIKASGSTAAVFDHSVVEAESVVSAQLANLRSGINQATSRWGVTAKPDLLSALINNVGERAAKRLAIEVHRDPELNLHRRAPKASGRYRSQHDRAHAILGHGGVTRVRPEVSVVHALNSGQCYTVRSRLRFQTSATSSQHGPREHCEHGLGNLAQGHNSAQQHPHREVGPNRNVGQAVRGVPLAARWRPCRLGFQIPATCPLLGCSASASGYQGPGIQPRARSKRT
jgi:hypothetical protein